MEKVNMHAALSFLSRAARWMILAATALVLGLTPAFAETVLKVIPQASLSVLDPIWTTGYITRNHGYLIYDTLFAMDEHLKPQPQMVDKWSLSPNKLVYTFTLRPGLKWHDGLPVTAKDCVASLKRWGARDVLGSTMMRFVKSIDAVNASTFTISLNEPYGLVLDSLAKISSNVPFMMPERVAMTDPQKQISDYTGSGPFRFVKDEFVPGVKAVYEKFQDYVPRKEKPSFLAGGKVAKVDKVEWDYIPDQNTAMAALLNGEEDYFENPAIDLIPLMKDQPHIVVANTDPLGNQGVLRANNLIPPFNNVKARQALYYLVDQDQYMRAIIGDPTKYKLSWAMFMTNGPSYTLAGTEGYHPDIAKAKELLKEGGYNGEKVVLLDPTDQFVPHNAALVTAQLLRKAGVNVEVQAMDWSTMLSRRANKGPLTEGGWNLFHTWVTGADQTGVLSNFQVAGSCGKGWFGWFCDPKIEDLKVQWAKETDPAKKLALASEIQKRAYEGGAYVPLGQFNLPTAYRDNLKGVIISPVTIFWNIEKQ
jgi:peptide/nickel transport system substrate-binding protein